MHVIMLPPVGKGHTPHKEIPPPPTPTSTRDWWEKWDHTQTLFFSARELMLYPEIFSGHLTLNFSGLMCLLKYRSILNRSGVGTKSLTSFQMILILLAHRPLWVIKVLNLKCNLGVTWQELFIECLPCARLTYINLHGPTLLLISTFQLRKLQYRFSYLI